MLTFHSARGVGVRAAVRHRRGGQPVCPAGRRTRPAEINEARRLALRRPDAAKDQLTLTYRRNAATGRSTGGTRVLNDMGSVSAPTVCLPLSVVDRDADGGVSPVSVALSTARFAGALPNEGRGGSGIALVSAVEKIRTTVASKSRRNSSAPVPRSHPKRRKKWAIRLDIPGPGVWSRARFLLPPTTSQVVEAKILEEGVFLPPSKAVPGPIIT